MSAIAKPAAPSPEEWTRPQNKAGLERLSRLVAPQLESALPLAMHGNAVRLLRALITECSNSPALFDCTPISLFGAAMQAGQLGLMIGGPLGQAYLIPFGGKAQLIVGYKGLLTLAHRSQMISQITPRIVREGDDFRLAYGTSQSITHVPGRGAGRQATDYYCVFALRTGGIDFEVLSHEEAIEHRDRYATTRKRKSGPWYEMAPGAGFEQMALKTVIRRIAKRLPLSPEIQIASQLEDQAEREIPQHLDTMIDVGQERDDSEPPPVSEQLRDRLDATREQARQSLASPAGDSPDADSAYAVIERYAKVAGFGVPRALSEIKAKCKIEVGYWTDFTADEVTRAAAYARERIAELESRTK